MNTNVFALFTLIVLLFYIINNNIFELFYPKYFGFDPSLVNFSQKCNSNNYCYPGSYFRSQIYQNMCQPNQGLLRQKIPLQNNCFKSLERPPKKFICRINKHLQRKCQWI